MVWNITTSLNRQMSKSFHVQGIVFMTALVSPLHYCHKLCLLLSLKTIILRSHNSLDFQWKLDSELLFDNCLFQITSVTNDSVAQLSRTTDLWLNVPLQLWQLIYGLLRLFDCRHGKWNKNKFSASCSVCNCMCGFKLQGECNIASLL